MAILAFRKPDKVLMLEAVSRFGKFEFRPLEPGFGITEMCIRDRSMTCPVRHWLPLLRWV